MVRWISVLAGLVMPEVPKTDGSTVYSVKGYARRVPAAGHDLSESRKQPGISPADDAALWACRASVRRFLLRRLWPGQDARDLLQEVYVRFLQAPQRELVREPLAYLYRIAANLVQDVQQREQHGPVTYDSEMADERAEQPADIWRDELGEPLNAQQELTAALEQLPAIYQAVLILRKRDGLSTVEIAKELGISKHTAEKYLYRAIAHLKTRCETELRRS